MILKVIKENSYFPLGTYFRFDAPRERFIALEREENTGDGYESITDCKYAFSIPYYEKNKEIFNQVKLEETNEKNKNNEGPESPSTQSESEDVCDQSEAIRHDPVVSRTELHKKLQRKEMEESPEERESSRNSVLQRRSNAEDKGYEDGGIENSRTARFVAIENQINKWDEQFEQINLAFGEFFNSIWNDARKLKRQIL